MVRFYLALLAFGASAVYAQSPADLINLVADHFNKANTFVVKGTASAAIPGSSWRVSYEFDTEGAQPKFLPLSVRRPSTHVISSVGHVSEVLAVAGATDPKPNRSFGLEPFGRDNELARNLADAQKSGTETITVGGHEYSCEIIDATYDYSPGFKPHSFIVHKRLFIDSSDLVVLREIKSSADGIEWTADVTSFSFDAQPSETMIHALQTFASQPKDRPDWVGRQVPDLTLPQLSGAPVKLSELRGKPVLLDFWGSYCVPCKRATLYAQELQKDYQSKLTVLTLTQDTADDARGWTAYNHVALPVLLDSDGAAFKAFEVEGVPVTILADGDGKVVRYWLGLDDLAEMKPVLDAILQASSAPAARRDSHP
jgi:cytochrome c biogenesis protein CcmG, thiol:disulfide interchange protein DsbE